MVTCFVAMPISVADELAGLYSDGKDHFAHVLDYLFTPAVTACGYEVISPVASGADLIHAEIIRNLEQADIVLCDISGLNPNVFFELGIRTALDRPVAIVKDSRTRQIPFDTGSINTYTYDAELTPWSLRHQIAPLTEHIRRAADGAAGHNPLWRYFGLTQRAAPPDIANPTEAKLDLIRSELAELRPLLQAASERERPGRLAASQSPAAPGYGPAPALGSPDGYGRAPAYEPEEGFGQAPGYGTASGYGAAPPSGYVTAPPSGYGAAAPSGYGPEPGYGSSGYGTAPGYGAPPAPVGYQEYGAPPVEAPADDPWAAAPGEPAEPESAAPRRGRGGRQPPGEGYPA